MKTTHASTKKRRGNDKEGRTCTGRKKREKRARGQEGKRKTWADLQRKHIHEDAQVPRADEHGGVDVQLLKVGPQGGHLVLHQPVKDLCGR